MANTLFDRLLRPSTRAFYRESKRTDRHRFLNSLHGYVYARWPYFYVGVGTGEHPLARILAPLATILWKDQNVGRKQSAWSSYRSTFANTYHGKVVPLFRATPLVTVNVELKGILSPRACMGYGICVNRYQHHASTLVRDPSRGEPLSIRSLMEEAAVSGD